MRKINFKKNYLNITIAILLLFLLGYIVYKYSNNKKENFQLSGPELCKTDPLNIYCTRYNKELMDGLNIRLNEALKDNKNLNLKDPKQNKKLINFLNIFLSYFTYDRITKLNLQKYSRELVYILSSIGTLKFNPNFTLIRPYTAIDMLIEQSKKENINLVSNDVINHLQKIACNTLLNKNSYNGLGLNGEKVTISKDNYKKNFIKKGIDLVGPNRNCKNYNMKPLKNNYISRDVANYLLNKINKLNKLKKINIELFENKLESCIKQETDQYVAYMKSNFDCNCSKITYNGTEYASDKLPSPLPEPFPVPYGCSSKCSELTTATFNLTDDGNFPQVLAPCCVNSDCDGNDIKDIVKKSSTLRYGGDGAHKACFTFPNATFKNETPIKYNLCAYKANSIDNTLPQTEYLTFCENNNDCKSPVQACYFNGCFNIGDPLCTTDADCIGDNKCNKSKYVGNVGLCRATTVAGGNCGADYDCEKGQICNFGTCSIYPIPLGGVCNSEKGTHCDYTGYCDSVGTTNGHCKSRVVRNDKRINSDIAQAAKYTGDTVIAVVNDLASNNDKKAGQDLANGITAIANQIGSAIASIF